MKIHQVVLLAVLSTSFVAAQANDSNSNDSCKDMGMNTSITQSDANKDNVVTLEEYLATEKNNAMSMFKHIDANGDGKLDAAEQKVIDEIMQKMSDPHANIIDKQKNISM